MRIAICQRMREILKLIGRSESRMSLLIRSVPIIFVMLWSTGFIGAKLGLPYAEPFTFLAVRMAITLAILAPLSGYLSLKGQPIVSTWPFDGVGNSDSCVLSGCYFLCDQPGNVCGNFLADCRASAAADRICRLFGIGRADYAETGPGLADGSWGRDAGSCLPA